MDHRLTTRWVDQVTNQRNIYVGLASLSLMVNVIQGLERLMVSEKTIILPPDIKQGVWVTQKDVSPSYLEEWAMYLSSLALTMTPSTAAYKKDLFLRHVSPHSFDALKKMLEQEIAFLSKNQATVCFNPKTVDVEAGTLTVIMEGTRITYVGKEKVSEHPLTLTMTFEMSPGQHVYLTSFEFGDKGEAHEA